MYGVTNLLTRRSTNPDGTPNDTLKGHHLFPESREEDPAKWRLASPVSHIKRDSPPTLTLHSPADTVVDRDQAHELDRALRAAGAESTLKLVEGATHAWPLKTKTFDLTGEVVAFFDRHLKK
jgi:dipeptidyl aminopeptidase/acylaminoacyl peptidase